MKYSCKNLLLPVVALFAVSTLSARQNDWAHFGRYAEANRELKMAPADARRVVFMGNSITDNWASMRPDFFSSNDFVGRGISGQSTYQFLSRFRADVIELHPKAVVINAATNDIAENTHSYDEDLTFGNIVSMVELAQANGIKVILTSVLPAAAFNWNPSITDVPAKIAHLNARLKDYAKSHRLPFVDYYSLLVDADGKSLPEKYSKDGVHPNASGYEIMEAAILPAVRKIVK